MFLFNKLGMKHNVVADVIFGMKLNPKLYARLYESNICCILFSERWMYQLKSMKINTRNYVQETLFEKKMPLSIFRLFFALSHLTETQE